ncbi:hypothetical protein Kpho02_10790 [Kitasatospora phosalacinea]|uniref:Uncharacterized protein n=1 Tax=Kitasatospora phosalacinea TaxID=2065 RepID=A0A9W6V1C8_9ACTN|nr:hypothetical protein Kpho02_10790 [Kitasatospora phosalacinea]
MGQLPSLPGADERERQVRAVGFRANGDVDVPEELDLPEPVPTAGRVTVQGTFAGAVFAGVQHRQGEFGPPDGPGAERRTPHRDPPPPRQRPDRPGATEVLPLSGAAKAHTLPKAGARRGRFLLPSTERPPPGQGESPRSLTWGFLLERVTIIELAL